MPQLNVTYLGGYLCREPEIRYVGESGTALCQFSIAHTRSFQRNGEWQKETSFFDVKAWGTVAERAGHSVKVTRSFVRADWCKSDGKAKTAASVARSL